MSSDTANIRYLNADFGKGYGRVASIREHPKLTLDENLANAEFIFRACRFHDDLVEALEQIARLSKEGEVSAKMQYALGDIASAALAKANRRKP